ncbi:Aste57867_18946 [Aphanomyces stellatus]|uniref:Aste57867_18946 protein n=1 Tax=Aphanomyces stellatus TaxID=120398 RepID=A0A485LBL5_9STRA|nr:hypothetical protein As57867_018882 [Aphanomyces stellatus]VFT95676.1 Aste57867_18946 [Aphanomyces stellatus]
MSTESREEVFYFEEIPAEEDGHCKQHARAYTLSEFKASHGHIIPPKRGGAALTSITTQGKTRIYLIGGANRDADAFNDVHIFNLEEKKWTRVSPRNSSAFTPRSGHSAVAHGSFIYVFGGVNMQLGEVYNDLHVLDTVTMEWTQPNARGAAPSPRNSHAAVATTRGMLVLGGSSPHVGTMNDAFLLPWSGSDDELEWQSIACPHDLPKRELHAACASRGLVYVCGGRLETGQLCGELSIVDTDTWTWTRSQLPMWHRCAHASGILGSQWVHYGGWDGGHGFLGDCWELTLASPTSMEHVPVTPLDDSFPGMDTPRVELKLEPSVTIAGRFAHCGCVVTDSHGRPGLVFFGGMTVQDDLNDLWLLQLDDANSSK